MSRRHYTNFPPQQTLNASITAGATSLQISGSFVGWPTQFPFFAVLEYGTASAEIVSVTNIVSTTATIVRGQDGSTAISHAAGATFDHCVVALDMDEANAHINTSAGVHGVAGSLVGTTDTQTLTNKTLTAPVVNGGLTADLANVSGAVSAGSLSTPGSCAVASLTVGGVPINGPALGPLFPYTVDPLLVTGDVNIGGGATWVWYGRVTHPGSFSISQLVISTGGGGTFSAALLRDSGSGSPGALVAQSTGTSPGAASLLPMGLGGTFTVNRGDWFAVAGSGGSTVHGIPAVSSNLGHDLARAAQKLSITVGALTGTPTVAKTSAAIAIWGQ